MTPTRPSEVTATHTRIMKCALEAEDARAYWSHVRDTPPTAQEAFDSYWFGARSLARVKVLLANFGYRFRDYPDALRVLRAWSDMDPRVRTLICHWHLQLADPVYRAFTGAFLPARRDRLQPEITRDLVVAWVGDQGPSRWTLATRIQFASKLLSAAYSAGLVATNRDPRPLRYPRVPDEALTYLVYLLRGIEFEGTLLQNPYAASVGLDPDFTEERLSGLSALGFRRQGDLIDYGWRHPNLTAWAHATIAPDLEASPS